MGLSALNLEQSSLTELEKHLESIDSELKQLAKYSLNSGTGAIGYRSDGHTENVDTEWVQIDLSTAASIDTIVLAPVLWRYVDKGFSADALPRKFKIRVGASEDDKTGTVLGEYHLTNEDLERIAPFIIPAKGIPAKWIRLEASQLSKRAFDGEYVLQFSEIMVFSGLQNIALRAAVTASPNKHPVKYRPWSNAFLTDGHLPYLMDLADGEKSVAYISPLGKKPPLLIDLKNEYPIDQINLWEVEHNDTAPQGFSTGLGMPSHLHIEGASQPDFSDSKKLMDIYSNSPLDISPIMMWPVQEIVCRYIRISAVEGYNDLAERRLLETDVHMGFAEIEILSKGKNLALKAPVEYADPLNTPKFSRPLNTLTDGRNLYGSIVPTRDWLEQLARRHDLETQLPIVEATLKERYARQKRLLSTMIWIAVGISVTACIAVLMVRLIDQREMAIMRTRFAADLHDELGANLHSIGLISDIAQDAETPEEWRSLSKRIRELTELTGTAVRHCTNMLESKNLYIGLIGDMRRASDRITTNLQHDIIIEGEAFLNQLKARTSVDLFLFYKECLVNICRHSGATHITTHLSANKKELLLTVTDNGKGLPQLATTQKIPASLKRRAQLLKADMHVEDLHTGGTRVRLQLSIRKWILKP